MSTFAQRVQLGPFFSAGAIAGGAKLEHYEAGTSTLKNIWSDRAMSTTLAQPFIADADGVFNFFADGLYKLVIKKSDDTLLYTLDNWQFIDRTDPTFGEGIAITAASTIAVGPEVFAHITGSTNIDTITGTIPFFWAVFDGTPRLNHSANLLCPSGLNYTVRAGEAVFFLNEGSGAWRIAGHWMPGKQTDISSAATMAIAPHGSFVDITGTVMIEGLASSFAGHMFTARITNSAGLNILHSTSLRCPFLMDYRTVFEEVIGFVCLGATNWAMYAISGAPHLAPGTTISGWFEVAPVGGLLNDGAAINATTYHGLSKELILRASTLGNIGTSVGTFTANAGTDVLTITAHGLPVNDIFHVTTSAADLPLGLAIDTPYYVKTVPTSDTLTLSATRGGTTLDIQDAGTGTHTLHNKVNVPDKRGRAHIMIDGSANRITSASNGGSNADTLGGVGGAETHALTETELASHEHDGSSFTATGGGPNTNINAYGQLNTLTATAVTSHTFTAGGGGAHSNTQPWMAEGEAIRF